MFQKTTIFQPFSARRCLSWQTLFHSRGCPGLPRCQVDRAIDLLAEVVIAGHKQAQCFVGTVIWVAGRRELVSRKLTHFYWFHQLKSGFDRLSPGGNWFDNGYQPFSNWASMKPPSNFHEWTMAACAGGTSFGFRTALSHHVLRTKRGGLKRRPCFFLKMDPQKRRVLGVFISMQIREGSGRKGGHWQWKQ